jgi:hypothetical protein
VPVDSIWGRRRKKRGRAYEARSLSMCTRSASTSG